MDGKRVCHWECCKRIYGIAVSKPKKDMTMLVWNLKTGVENQVRGSKFGTEEAMSSVSQYILLLIICLVSNTKVCILNR